MNVKKTAMKVGIAAALLVAGTAAAFAAPAEATSAVNVRQGPGTQYGIVDQLYAGENVDVRECTSGWCRITHSGPDGWVSANYLTRDSYYDDDADFVIRAPRIYRPFPRYRPYPYSSFCFGGNNAQFCFRN